MDVCMLIYIYIYLLYYIMGISWEPNQTKYSQKHEGRVVQALCTIYQKSFLLHGKWAPHG